jgi:tetratricopeptide (TPR) repeat protein
MNVLVTMQLQIANQYRQIGRLREAEATYQVVLRSEPDNSKAHEALGMLYLQRKEHDSARHHLTRASELNPENPSVQVGLADLHQGLGEFDDAKACFRRAIALQPEAASRYYLMIAQISRFSTYDDDIRTIEQLYTRVGSGNDDRMYLAFALGKAFDDLGDYRRAFGLFAEGNRMARVKHEFSPADLDETYRRIVETFDQDFLRRFSGIGLDDPKPIFVTGLPRSGSTLVEQILAKHSAVFGAGELTNLHDIAEETARALGGPNPEAFRHAKLEILQGIAHRYLDDLTAIADGEAHVTDKSLGSVIYVGLISAILPRAKIIYCRRDLRDMGLSCYQKYFGDQQSYSYDLRNIAKYFQGRENLMDHWKKMFPGRIFSIKYEDLVADTEGWTRKLMDYCDLSFEPECLSLQDTPRMVRTLSLEQVRRPIYSSSIGRWKNYAQELQPLSDALGIATD